MECGSGNEQGGEKKQIEAAYCVCALPFSMLKKIPNDLSEPYPPPPPPPPAGDRWLHDGVVVQAGVGESGASGSRSTTSMVGCRLWRRG